MDVHKRPTCDDCGQPMSKAGIAVEDASCVGFMYYCPVHYPGRERSGFDGLDE